MREGEKEKYPMTVSIKMVMARSEERRHIAVNASRVHTTLDRRPVEKAPVIGAAAKAANKSAP